MVARALPRWRAVVLDLWPLGLALLLVLPLMTGTGHPLARDLVFVPHQPWTDGALGLGDAAPRAVPLDALVSLATTVVDGGVLARLLLPLILALAGWGTHRLLPGAGTVGRMVAGGFAVWNPFVVERLALGQWALLAGYAALPWIAVAALRWRDTGGLSRLAAVVGWLALASITPTGAMIGLATALVLGASRSRRTLTLIGVGVLLQLPWLLPGLWGAAAPTSDPGGVAAFAARAEGPGGVLTSVLGLGGVWDADSVPGTRGTGWGLAATLVGLAAIVAAVPRWRASWGAGLLLRVAAVVAGGLVLALASSTPWGADAVRWAVAEVPGAGLLRDAQKYVAPVALLVAVALGVCADALVVRLRSVGVEVFGPVVVVALALPVLMLPDATRVTWPTVRPVDFPGALDDAADLVAADPGDVVTLPWRSYRRFEWGNGLISSDPATRLLDAEVLVADDLAVGEQTVAGESRRAHDLGEALAVRRPAEVLPAAGITWVLVWRDDPAADQLDLSGLTPVLSADELALYRTAQPVASVPGVAAGTRWVVLLADLLAVLVVLLAAVTRILSRPHVFRRVW